MSNFWFPFAENFPVEAWMGSSKPADVLQKEQKRLTHLTVSIQNLRAQLDLQQTEKDSLVTRLGFIDAEIANLPGQIDRAEAERAALRKRNKTAEEDCRKIQKDLNGWVSAITNLEEKLDKYQAKQKDLKAKVDSKKASTEELEVLRAEVDSAHENAKLALSDARTDLKGSYEGLSQAFMCIAAVALSQPSLALDHVHNALGELNFLLSK